VKFFTFLKQFFVNLTVYIKQAITACQLIDKRGLL
jgi:hypothetical protein